jgi:hypothetical protein
MIELPDTSSVPVVRTDFSNDAMWNQLRDELMATDYNASGYEPGLDFVERSDLSGMSAATLDDETPRRYPTSYEHPFMIVVDTVAMNSEEHPVLLIDLNEEETTASFRALPREIAAIEANLSIANMDFFEFADSADEDGVFRGFE